MGPVVESRMVERRLSTGVECQTLLRARDVAKGGFGEIIPCMLGFLFR